MVRKVQFGLRKLKLLPSSKYKVVPAVEATPCEKCYSENKTFFCDCRGCKAATTSEDKAKIADAYRWDFHVCYCKHAADNPFARKVEVFYRVYKPASDKTICWSMETPVSVGKVSFEVLVGSVMSNTCTRRINSIYNYIFFVDPDKMMCMLKLHALSTHGYYFQQVGRLPEGQSFTNMAPRFLSGNFNNRKKAHVLFSEAGHFNRNVKKVEATERNSRKKFSYMQFDKPKGIDKTEWIFPYARELVYAYLLIAREWHGKLSGNELDTAYEIHLRFMNWMSGLKIPSGEFDEAHGNSDTALEVRLGLAKMIATIAFYPNAANPHTIVTDMCAPTKESALFWRAIFANTRLRVMPSPKENLHDLATHLLSLETLADELARPESQSERLKEWDTSSFTVGEFKEWVGYMEELDNEKKALVKKSIDKGLNFLSLGLIRWPKYWFITKKDDEKSGVTFYK